MLYIRRVFKGYLIQIWNINKSKFNNRSRFNQNTFNNHDSSSSNHKNSSTNREININGSKIRINHKMNLQSEIATTKIQHQIKQQIKKLAATTTSDSCVTQADINNGKLIKKESQISATRLPVTVEKAKLAQPPASDLQDPDLGAAAEAICEQLKAEQVVTSKIGVERTEIQAERLSQS